MSLYLVYNIFSKKVPESGDKPIMLEQVYAQDEQKIFEYIELKYGNDKQYNDRKIFITLLDVVALSDEYLEAYAYNMREYMRKKAEVEALEKELFAGGI